MMTDRSSLTSRQIPQMTLGTGAPGSLTAPPAPPPHNATPAERAARRFGLHGKNAVVTGGAGDLGAAVCRALLEHGLCGLMVFDLLGPAEAEPRMAALRAEFPGAVVGFLRVDVTDEAAVEEAVRSAEERFAAGGGEGGEKVRGDGKDMGGGIDILLNFVGIVSCGHALSFDAADWARVLSVNTVGGAVVATAVARRMIAGGRGGSMVFVASISAHGVNYPQPQAPYNVSKAGVRALVKSLAAEWAVHGIRVNCISPGYMDTILNEGPGLENARREWLARCPMGRMGSPDELSGAVVMLASRAGSYITGTDLLIDGGQTLLV
ncbi:hypothetical protein DL766_003637 [Monosporascus sp. MC13-8B]|uniref:Ketoreductase (KR) domain-containing protein n=1 Tax=Monosporascus cannonballus TaxID=155416 RepID=A0ABY0H9F1_9PEZI|nr:hypothetical protein DL762_004922 [Monosporascus cannonballus]RYO91560.1 hypothetical protein DL763_004941 [Monosporascus cannonballus]RYP33137.1 hypothetical protein DL766_003637 [Monosporascus sp. MC13-8B]